MNEVKPAAIFARVSTDSQAETSLPSQVSRCRDKLAQLGYTVVRVFNIDFSSMDLYSSPDFQDLRRMIQNHEITALAVYDRDRLAAKGLQRLLFMSELKEASVELIVCSGPPIIDGPEGQIVELALAVGKERQVLRARQGSRDGLHDRVAIFKKPVTYHKVYGYQWDKLGNRLIPDGNHTNVKMLFDMILNGAGYTPVINEFQKRGIPSPSGDLIWNKNGLSSIIHNPIYAGRYYGLKKKAVPPKKRRGNTYGNSSIVMKPLSEALYVPEIAIVDPPITWEQREKIIATLAVHQKLASRNAKRDYLLRGIIFCNEHRGKAGEPRRYRGMPKRDSHLYVCPVGGHPSLNGPKLESAVKLALTALIMKKESEFFKMVRPSGLSRETLQRQLKDAERRGEHALKMLAKLEDEFLSGNIDRDTYPIHKVKYQAQRKGADDTRNELLEKLSLVGREADAFQSLKEVRRRFVERMAASQSAFHDTLNSDLGLSNTEWRELFVELGVRLDAGFTAEDRVTHQPAQLAPSSIVFNSDSHSAYLHDFGVILSVGVPILPQSLSDIALVDAEPWR